MAPGSSLSELQFKDFEFAFNDVNFSDIIMRMEILPDSPEPEPNPDERICNCVRNRKRLRVHPVSDANGHEVDTENEPSSSMEHSGVQVRTLYINSVVLAAESPFFYKFFSIGVEESREKRHVTLQVQASEEDAVMDMIKFMYIGALPRTTPTALLDVLMVADNFKVWQCKGYCIRLLRKLPMTCELALLYLNLPSRDSIPDTLLRIRDELVNAARKYLVDHFMDFCKNNEELLTMPLAAIKAVLCSDNLIVSSEDEIYDFVVKWAELHFPNLEERREILSNHLLRLVRFPHMTNRKLRLVLTCVGSGVVSDALSLKAEAPEWPCSRKAGDPYASYRRYTHLPVKIVEFKLPRRQCVVYLDVKRVECWRMSPNHHIVTQAFHLGEQGFYLSARCKTSFALFLGTEEGSEGLTVDYEFAARKKDSEDFVTAHKAEGYTFMGDKLAGSGNLFSMPRTEFIADDSPYFINGLLHLKVEIAIKE